MAIVIVITKIKRCLVDGVPKEEETGCGNIEQNVVVGEERSSSGTQLK